MNRNKMFAFAAALLFSLFSCKDAPPTIQNVQFKAVFDFSSDTEPAESYALLFVQPSSEEALASHIVLKHIQSGYTWNVSGVERAFLEATLADSSGELVPALTTLKTSDGAWVGSAGLFNSGSGFFSDGTVRHGAMPQGNYSVRYIDTSERESEIIVSLIYPLSLATDLVDAALNALQSSAKRIALYDARESLLYFGARKQNWQDMTAAKGEFSSAAFYRECFVAPGYSSVVMLPLRIIGAEDVH
jgi:hypothetical protein